MEGTCLPCVLILALKKQQWHNPSYSCKLTWSLYFWINAAELAWATHNSMGRKGALSCQEHRSISTATAAAHHNWHKHKPASHLHMTYSMLYLLSTSSATPWIKKLLGTATDTGTSRSGWSLLVALWKDATKCWLQSKDISNSDCGHPRPPSKLSSISASGNRISQHKMNVFRKLLDQTLFSPPWVGDDKIIW